MFTHSTKIRARKSNQRGVTLVELLVVGMLLALMTTIAVPTYDEYAERARISKAISDLRALELQIERFRLNNNDRAPDSLAELGVVITADPWGNDYRYLSFRDNPGKKGVRKDGALNPINTSFDLYSVGRDGDTKAPLPAPVSHDDIIRANDGAFVGLAEEY